MPDQTVPHPPRGLPRIGHSAYPEPVAGWVFLRGSKQAGWRFCAFGGCAIMKAEIYEWRINAMSLWIQLLLLAGAVVVGWLTGRIVAKL